MRSGFVPHGPKAWWRLALGLLAAALALLVVLQRPPWSVFAAAGNNMGVDEFVEAYTWIAAVLGIIVLGVLWALCPWWVEAPAPVAGAPAPRAPRWFGPLVAGAVLAGGLLSSPLLYQSLEADECMSLRESILGRFRRVPPEGEVEFKEVGWKRTIYGYKQVNNHILASILARISNGIWRVVARPEGLQFNEVALRLPFFLSALASIAAYALLLRAFGHPHAGILCAWLLALHPWFERYAALARGYALVFLLLPVIVLTWRRGLLDGRWRWWAIFSLCHFLALWAYPGTLFFLVPLNLLTLGLFVTGAGMIQPVRTVMSRWFCCNALAAVAALPLMLPLFPQVRAYFDAMPPILVGAKWVRDVVCLLLTDRWWSGEGEGYSVPDVARIWYDHPAVFWSLLSAVVFLLVVGFARFVRSGALAMCVALAWAVAPVLQFWYARHEQIYIWVYYVIYVLPFVMGLLALGLTAPLAGMARGGMARVFVPLAGLVFFAWATHGMRVWQHAHSATLLRESVLLTRPDLDYRSPANRRILTAGITSAPLSYDANFLLLRSETELALLCFQAERTGRPLFLNQGHLWILRHTSPVVCSMMGDSALFEEVAQMRGETPAAARLIVKYRPGAADKVDWTRYLSPPQLEFAKVQSALDPEEYFLAKRPDAP